MTIGRISGHWLGVPDEFTTEVGDFVGKRFEGTSDGQARQVQRSLLRTRELSRRSAGFTFPSAGLLDAMAHVAREWNVQLTRIMSLIERLPTPVRSVLSQNPVIADFIHRSRSGTIEYGGNVTKIQIVAEICMAFPHHRVLVLSSDRHELRNVFNGLSRFAPFVSRIDVSRGELPFGVDDDSEVLSCQLVLSTPLNAAVLDDTAGTNVREFPVVICLDAARAKDLMIRGFLMASHAKFRIFGLHRIGTPLYGEAADWVHNVFGPAFLRVPQNGFEQSEMSYVEIANPYKTRNMPRRPKPVDAIRLVSLCSERNNLIANVARSLVDGNRFDDDERIRFWMQRQQIERPMVSIIARSFQQAARIARRLPGWRVYRPNASPDLLQGMPPADRRLLNESSNYFPVGDRVICPLDYQGQFLTDADPQIVIDGSGGFSPPAFPKTWLRHPAGTQRCRLVIDLFDWALPLTRRISRQRIAQYQYPEFLPVVPGVSQNELSVLLAILPFIQRTFQPARRRRSR